MMRGREGREGRRRRKGEGWDRKGRLEDEGRGRLLGSLLTSFLATNFLDSRCRSKGTIHVLS